MADEIGDGIYPHDVTIGLQELFEALYTPEVFDFIPPNFSQLLQSPLGLVDAHWLRDCVYV